MGEFMSTTLTERLTKGLEDVVAGTTSICNIDVQTESLLYRGYNAVDLSERTIFEEVVYLLIEGKLPKKRELKRFSKLLVSDRKISKPLIKVLKNIPQTANPMDVLRTSVSYMGTIAENKNYTVEETKQIAYSLIAQLPFALMTWWHISKGQDVPKVSKKITYAGRFLQLVTGNEPDPFEEKVINSSFVLYAEHEFNASTFCARVAASTLSDIYSAITAAIGTLKGPLHGGANEAAMNLILKFSNANEAESGVNDILNRKEKIMGFGHRVYKKGDSRSTVMKKYALELAKQKGKMQLFEIAERIEKVVKEKKGLFANADFYSAVVYYLLGVPVPLYTPIFVLSRTSGWAAHIIEQLSDNKLIRPRAIYQGSPPREVPAIERR